MTPIQAHELLDAAKRGADVSVGGITRALRATGDLSRSHQIPTITYRIPPMGPVGTHAKGPKVAA